MCDYSLMTIDNRLAIEGEDLVAHHFRSGSTGLVSRSEFELWQARRPSGFWQSLTRIFRPQPDPTLVVCVPPGARLRIHGLDSCSNATFTQVYEESSRHRDALRFDDGRTTLLQSLPEGQSMTVIRFFSTDGDGLDLVQPELVLTE